MRLPGLRNPRSCAESLSMMPKFAIWQNPGWLILSATALATQTFYISGRPTANCTKVVQLAVRFPVAAVLVV